MERVFDTQTLWIVIASLAIGSYVLRFTFLGIVGNRPLPEWLLRHLRYTAVAILPALVTPLVIWPAAAGGQPDPKRLAAAAAALTVAYMSKNVLWGVVSGAAVLLGLGQIGL